LAKNLSSSLDSRDLVVGLEVVSVEVELILAAFDGDSAVAAAPVEELDGSLDPLLGKELAGLELRFFAKKSTIQRDQLSQTIYSNIYLV
jgi:hypothetical protein